MSAPGTYVNAGDMIVLKLDRWTSAHLAAALQLHFKACRDNPHRVPPLLRELLEIATEKAKSGTSRDVADTTDNLLDAVADLLQDRLDGEQELFTTDEAADRLRVCVRTVRRLVALDDLGAIKIGRAWRIPRAELEAYLIGHGLRAGIHDERSAVA